MVRHRTYAAAGLLVNRGQVRAHLIDVETLHTACGLPARGTHLIVLREARITCERCDQVGTRRRRWIQAAS